MFSYFFRIIAMMIILVTATAGCARGESVAAAQGNQTAPATVNQPAANAADPLIYSYPASFSCLEGLQPGTYYYGVVAPLDTKKTEVVIRNPNAFAVDFYKQAVHARAESAPVIAPGAWVKVNLLPGQAIRVDCDDITVLLTGNPAATFLGTYGIGVAVTGMVDIALGPQTVTGRVTPASLEVTATYTHRSEFLKKDISYQAWWWWWWWPLPWRLGYPYERILTVSNPADNIDCRSLLYTALLQDANTLSPTLATLTQNALYAGSSIDPTTITTHTPTDTPALVPLIGKCEKQISAQGAVSAVVDYVLVSNKTSTDPDPRGTGNPAIYPWIPGRWYDLTVVVPQGVSVDLDDYIRKWHTQRWIDAGVSAGTVSGGMVYFYPWWCGVQAWYGWGGTHDCVDIAVGNTDSVDVMQVTPSRIFMPTWPPV